MTISNEVAVREGVVITPADRAAAAAAASDLDSWLIVMKDVVLLAEHICDTSFVPKAYRGNAPAVAAAILAGRELALPPMTSLRHVQVVEGSPSLSAEYKRARVLSAGHKLDIDEHTTEACQVTGHRKGHQSVTVRFTIADARKAGLVKDRGAYMTRPRRMLFARACTEVCDALFSDLTNGLPTAELIEGEDEDLPPATEAARPAAVRVTAERLRDRRPQHATATVVTEDSSPAPAGPPAAPAVTPAQQGAGEDPTQAASSSAAENQSPPRSGPSSPSSPSSSGTAPGDEDARPARVPGASPGQVGLIRKYFERLGYSDSDEDRVSRLSATATLAGYDGDLHTTSDLGAGQAAQVLRQLEKCRDAPALLDLLQARIAPEGATDGE